MENLMGMEAFVTWRRLTEDFDQRNSSYVAQKLLSGKQISH